MSRRMTEVRSEKGLDEVPRQLRPFDLSTQTNHIKIIVLDSLLSREVVLDQACRTPLILFKATAAPTPLPIVTRIEIAAKEKKNECAQHRDH